jgi:hypothetical protein
MDWKTAFLLGCAGGAIPDVIRFCKQRYKDELPKIYKRWHFWLAFVFLVLLGGIAASLAGAQVWHAALAYGFTAPEALSRLLSSGPVTLSKPHNVISRWWSF